MIDNGELYTKIMDKLKFEPSLNEKNITVSVKENGIVVLGGKVESYTEKYIAEEAVKKIENVRAIANELEVELAMAYKRSDVDIAQDAVNALQYSIFVPSERIKVIVEHGHLILSGKVSHYFHKERAEKAVQDIVGIKDIANNIEVTPDIKPFEVKEKIIKEFERNARIDANNIEVEVDGSEVILRGKVRNFDEEKEARRAAWYVPGVSKVTDLLTIGV
ncbi:BON domain-containing protein [Holosporaceae bacterium 'Namur']|nr:BON domain-containing protein [Holosporaceae bacterium 'Namur']